MKSISVINILKGLIVSVGLIAVLYFVYQLPILNPLRLKIPGKKSISDQVEAYEAKVNASLQPLFEAKNVVYPPELVTLLFIKSKRVLELYASNARNEMRLIKVYPVLAASGIYGPKLKSGDYQVPEGLYSIESLNPNSAFHLSLRVNYPNAYDLKRASDDGRIDIGSDIMIHGNKVSVGCVAIGDEAIEELFVLAANSDYKTWKFISSPVDFRLGEVAPPPGVHKDWVPELYQKIAEEMQTLLSRPALGFSAPEIAKRKGVVDKKDVLEWKPDKVATKLYKKIANEYFELSIPTSGFEIEAHGEESDPSKSASWGIERKRSGESWVISNGFSISYGGQNAQSLLAGMPFENLLLKQPLRVNGLDGYLQVDAIDSRPVVGSSEYGEGGFQVRWMITIICKGRVNTIIHMAQSGNVSLNLVKKGDYVFPEDFKNIISTFQCK